MNENVISKVLHQTEAPKKIEILENEEDWVSEDDGASRKPPVPEVAEPSQPDQVMESESEIHTSEIE